MSAPDDNPKSVHGMRKPPLHLIPPVAKIEMATAFKLGAEKYGPFNWRESGVSASTYKAAAERHLDAFWDGEDIDAEAQCSHLAGVMACCAVLLDAMSVGKFNDDRPSKGVAAEAQRAWINRFEPPIEVKEVYKA